MDDFEFEFEDTAKAPGIPQDFLMENLCGMKGKGAGGYKPPATRSASKRWKRIHEQSMMMRLDEMHVIKKQNAQMSKEAARKIIRKIPVELLAREWLSKEDATVDMRAYLVDHVLPTLILGVERLLKEVDEKGLSTTSRFEPEFNPINFLAQYLMRNNPRFSNFAEASPYVRGLREVSEEIKQELFTFEDNRLARIKAEARRKRNEREKIEQRLRQEKERRQMRLITQFHEWNVPTDNNRVELSLLQNALRSFAEIAEKLPEELREVAKFGHPLEPTDETGRTLAVQEFAQYISLFVEDLPMEVFEQFMVHMSKCAAAHRASAERENRRIVLTNLFILCDHGGLGLLDRYRVLNLFEQFWDLAKGSSDPKGTLRNPRKWPVVEVDEVDDIMFDAGDEDDGGLETKEVPVARMQMMRVRDDLSKKTVTALKNDKEAQEKWKMEQLLEKSEGSEGEETADVTEVDKQTEEQEETVAGDSQVDGDKPEESVAPENKELEEEGEKAEEKKEEESKEGEEGEKEGAGEEKKDEEEGEKVGSEVVEKVEGGTGTEEESALNFDSTEAKTGGGTGETAGETEKEVASQEVLEKEKDESMLDAQEEDMDVDITKEIAESVSKSALRNPDGTATGRISVTFAGHTAFDRERTAEDDDLITTLAQPTEIFLNNFISDKNENRPSRYLKDFNESSCHRVRNLRVTTNSRSQSQMSAFDETVLNVSQFVQLIETFLGHNPNLEAFNKLVKYIKEGYQETEEEKMDRLVKARKEAISAKRKLMMDTLFEKWDNDGSGFLEMEDVQEVMLKYKDGQEMDAIKRAHSNLKKKSKYQDQRLSRREFRQFIELIVDELPGSESFEYFVEFLTNSVERSYAERIRGEARKKWLSQIVLSSQTSGTNLDAVYKNVFQALYKDAEAHGGEKKISASISMLETNKIEPSRGDLLLRYTACTPEDCKYMLGKVLFKNMKGISFEAVESGKPIHAPRVANHGNVYFWNYDRVPEDREGSFIVVPLKDFKKRVFGVMGIDTMVDTHKKSIFITHEIQFFQGVAKAFSIAYHNVELKRKLLRITESAISWIQRRCPHITEIIVYMVEPNTKADGSPVLRKMMTTDKKGAAVQVTETIRLERKDNLFRDYLFKCMDNSETVAAEAYGERHTASPLRDDQGKAIGVVDISIGEMKRLPLFENKEAQRMLRLLQQAHREITREAEGNESLRVLEAENNEDSRMDIMFDRLMLMELRENVSRLDPQAFAELRSYNVPPPIINEILRATLAIFHLEKAGGGEFEDWQELKNYINGDLVQQIKTYDPTQSSQLIDTEKVEKYLKAVPHGEVAKYGSIPAQQLYNWVFVCISLIEHTRKMRENAKGSVMVSAEEETQKSKPTTPVTPNLKQSSPTDA